MALTTKALPREFSYNGIKLPDPDSSLSIEQVRELFTASYPEIATAAITAAGVGVSALGPGNAGPGSSKIGRTLLMVGRKCWF